MSMGLSRVERGMSMMDYDRVELRRVALDDRKRGGRGGVGGRG